MDSGQMIYLMGSVELLRVVTCAKVIQMFHLFIIYFHHHILFTYTFYIGYFQNGKREGYAIEKYLSGNSYHGEFQADERHG